MAAEIILPKFGFTLEESQIVAWLKQEGEFVEVGDPIAEVTTDKVNMEVEATAEGTLAGFQFQEGDTVPVTAVIAYVLAPGERLPETAAAKTGVTPVAARFAQAEGIDLSQIEGSGPGGRITRKDVEAGRQPASSPASSRQPGTNGTKVSATPAARRLARDHNLSLGNITGTGPDGRIQKENVAAALANIDQSSGASPLSPATPADQAAASTYMPFNQLRRTIAQNMQRSKHEAPHVPFEIDVDMTAVLALTQRANELLHDGKDEVTVTAVLTKATAWTLMRHPVLNSHMAPDGWLQFAEANIGLAVALNDGLVVPVIQQANQKGITRLAAEIKAVAQRARAGKLRPGDMLNGTFTLSNLGMYGVDRFAAIINPPQVAILAVGQTSRRIVPDAADRPVVRPICTLTLSVDHRVVDGATAARFLADLRLVLNDPGLLSL